MELFDVVEGFTQIITYVMIVSGIPPCVHMWRSGDTGSIPYPFFLASLVTAIFSLGYGIIVGNGTVMQINAVSTFFNICYIAAYIYVSKSKRKPMNQLLVCVAILLSIYIYLSRFVAQSRLMDHLGVVLFLCTGVFLLTPLLSVRECMQKGSAAELSLSMMISGLLCSASWFSYGLLLNDFYIYAPNVFGVFSNSCQVLCLVGYGTRPTKSSHRD